MSLKNTKQYSWQLPPALQIQQIAEKLHVTAEIVQMDDPWYIPSDAPKKFSDQLGESPTQLRSYLLP